MRYVMMIVVGLIAGCARYNATALSMVPPESLYNAPVQKGVVVVARALNKEECKRYLDRDVMSKGYQPVQLYIENRSDQAYFFSTSRVTLPLASPEEVAEKVHTSTVGRVAGYGAAAIIATPLFVLPAVIDGYKSVRANEALDSDFAAKGAKDVVIYPHSHVNMLLFVPVEGYEKTFTVTLLDEENHRPNKITARVSS